MIGLFSLASLSIFTIILWTSIKGSPPDEEDRCSFRRSMKILSIVGLIRNAFQILFLIDKSTPSISLIGDSGTFGDIFESIDQFFYSAFIYSLALCLVKPVVWPHLRVDSCLYPISLIPPALNLLMRIVVMLETQHIYDDTTKDALHTTVSVISSFILYLVPLTLTAIAAILNSRRQTEHFMKVCIQRMSLIFTPHLFLACLSFSLYAFAFCHSFDYNMQNNTWQCKDRLEEDSGGTPSIYLVDNHNSSHLTTAFTTAGPQPNTTTTQQPDPSSLLSPLSVSTSVINVLANLFLPAIPAAFLYTVAEILGE